MWLLDTVTLSETFKVRRNPGLVAWLEQQPVALLATSVLCLGEIRRGAERLADAERRERITRWLEDDLPALLADRILVVDEPVAHAWGRMGARRTLSPVDSLIGATALVHGLTVVTRNTRDFDGLGVPVLNPWT
jgi:predicted nucleic acid-binding protein